MVTNPTVRFATFNASLNRGTEGQLATDLSTPDNAQARAVAEIIQRNNPDVLLINEFDYLESDPLLPVRLFQENYLSVSQNGAGPVEYPYVYIAPSNTGLASGFDFDNNGVAVTTPNTPGYGDDALGFGVFPGQFGMLFLSKYPIDTENIRTFQNFLWKDMPGALISAIALPGSDTPWYSEEEQAIFPLSSKSHWDIPVQIDGETIHVLASHPTPPVFDGPEDRNGKRNFDEIRLWADYVTPGQGDYLYDDQGQRGGLAPGSKFVILGDQNADPLDGDSFNNAILQLLQNPGINTNFIPTSPGAPEQSALQGRANLTHLGNPSFDTADFADGAPGNLRVDYVLPSTDLTIENSGVFWPLSTDSLFPPVGTFSPSLPGGFPSSDHRLVWVDIPTGPAQPGRTVADTEFISQTIIPTGFIPPGEAGVVNGSPTQLGGLSGITYDPINDIFYAISDDRSVIAPARFYTFTADPSTLDAAGATFTNVTVLLNDEGEPFAANTLDTEDIILTDNDTVFISSEGEVSFTTGRVSDPFVNEFSLSGELIRSLPVPTKFLPVVEDTNGSGVVDVGDTQLSGVRNNLAFESLTITPDQRTLFTATESALFQDGPIATLTAGSQNRILQYNLVTGQPEKEYLYITEPIAAQPNPPTGFGDNGLVDLLALDDRGTILSLERSFSVGVGNTIRIFEISLQGATDISTIDSLNSLSAEELAAITPVEKRLVLNLNSLELPTGTDNIEGLGFGPQLPDGRQSIVLVSDNNFSASQFTQILALGADLVPTAIPTVETRPDLFDDPALPDDEQADADDPAIYYNPSEPGASLVLTAVKNAGLRIYNLAGQLLQEINPGDIRYNNIDIQYGFNLGGESIDIAVATDRNNDTLAIFKIDPNPSTPGAFLEDITDDSLGTFFQDLPFEPPYSASSRSAYGIALYRSPVTNDYYAFVNRRETGDVIQLKLVDTGNGTIGAESVRNFTVPTTEGRDPQLEGMVADQELGFLYVGQEDVGIWKYLAEPDGGTTGMLIDRVEDLGGDVLEADVEGLTIYYAGNGTGYLLASSQGDNTFVAYTREGNNDFVGRFAIGQNGAIDSVQESDGADVLNLPLGPNFPFGLLVVQDGDNLPARLVEDDDELENINSNFKFVPWENVVSAVPNPLVIDTTSYNPITPTPNSLLNGVASGDTTQTSTVLWARSNFTGPVTFEYSTTDDFSSIAGTVEATVTDPLLPVKVEVTGLTPGTQYYYRATDAAGASAAGQFETANTLGTFAGFRLGVSGDWRGELSPYPAIANAPDMNLDLFVLHGDTVYADFPSPAVTNLDGTEVEQAVTLDQFRAKNAEVYGTRFGENFWSELRASTSVLATIDDHEVTNDFQGGKDLATAPEAQQELFGATTGLVNDSPLYENGLQAFQEYNPILDKFYGETGDPRTAEERKLYRFNTFGSDAATFVIDTRSFRDEAVEVDLFDPNRTFLGEVQFEDLKSDLLAAERSGINWKFVLIPEPIQNLGPVGASDRYEGYPAERTELLKFIDDNEIRNVVFVAADIHGTVTNNLTYQLGVGQPQIALDAFEITTGSVAFDAPFGPTVIELATAAGLLTPEEKAFFDALPIANDADSIVNDRDDFIKQLINQGIVPLGFDPVGLNDNLPIAEGLINAQLLQGDYVATQTYGWTAFEIDPETQQLTVTTYGIEPYTREEVEATPSEIIARQPAIVSQFTVTSDNVIRGTDGDDTLFGTPGDDIIFGFDGNDVIFADEGNNIVRAGSGTKTIYGGAGDDFIDAGDGVNSIFAAEGNNRIILANGVNLVYVGAGDDVITTGNGSNTIYAAEGNNTVTTGTGNNLIYGGTGDDVITTGDGSNTIFAAEGNNTITTGSGKSLIYAGAGDDVITSGNGFNTIYAAEGNNTITTGSGNDLIYAGAGDDIITTGAGDDVIYAAEGNNLISAGIGNDTVYVGSGVDRFILDAGLGAVTIFGFSDADQVSLGNGLSVETPLTVSVSGDSTLISAGSDLLARLEFVALSSVNIV